MPDAPKDFPVDALETFLKRSIEGFGDGLQVTKFADGQSNPTYLLVTSESNYVLRAKPPGVLLKSAHAVDREFRVMNALHNTAVPVPNMILLASEDNPLGRMFFVMEKIDGTVFWDPTLPDLTSSQRTKIYASMNKTLAALHSLDPAELGLSDFGKPGNYFERQSSRWASQYLASCDQPDADMLVAMQWLSANMVPDDGGVALVHGDYRLDNMMFNPDGEVVALLDWELSTLGHPLADLAYQCMQWRMPHYSPLRGLGGIDRAALGLPSEQEYVSQYAAHRNLDTILNWNFYIVFSFFRLTAILQGVYQRAQAGNASNPDKANAYGRAIPELIRLMRVAIDES